MTGIDVVSVVEVNRRDAKRDTALLEQLETRTRTDLHAAIEVVHDRLIENGADPDRLTLRRHSGHYTGPSWLETALLAGRLREFRATYVPPTAVPPARVYRPTLRAVWSPILAFLDFPVAVLVIALVCAQHAHCS